MKSSPANVVAPGAAHTAPASPGVFENFKTETDEKIQALETKFDSVSQDIRKRDAVHNKEIGDVRAQVHVERSPTHLEVSSRSFAQRTRKQSSQLRDASRPNSRRCVSSSLSKRRKSYCGLGIFGMLLGQKPMQSETLALLWKLSKTTAPF